MFFIIQFKTDTGRMQRVNYIAPSFEECLKKILPLYGKNLVYIVYDARKNNLEVER